MPRSIYPYNRSGIWKTDYPLYVDEAVALLDEFKTDIDKLNLLKRSIPDDDHERDEYFFEVIDPQQSKIHMSYVKLTLMCCMTIEAFLNYYGVRRFGDKFYNDNIERLNPIKKINIIMAICFQEVYRDKDEAINEIKNLFNIRNGFVHPTTKEYAFSDLDEKPELFAPKIYTHEAAKNIIKSLKLFFDWFKKHDSGIDLEYEIKKLSCDT